MLKVDLQLFGVVWHPCSNCGRTFPDCGEFVRCICGKRWCCSECAEKEGYEIKDCEKWDLDKDSDYNYENVCENCIPDMDCDCEGEIRSCDYCRNEEFEDSDLLEFMLSKENKSRQEVVDDYKKYFKETR